MRFIAAKALVAPLILIAAPMAAALAEEPLHLECAGPFGRDATLAA